jgi:hypothetical protein
VRRGTGGRRTTTLVDGGDLLRANGGRRGLGGGAARAGWGRCGGARGGGAGRGGVARSAGGEAAWGARRGAAAAQRGPGRRHG